MTEPVSPRRARLGAALRELRATRFRSGSELARRLDWPQSRLSKIERGIQLPSESDLTAWVRATDASPEQVEQLRDLVASARLGYRVWSDAWGSPGGIAASQDEIADADARATRIAEYQPSMIPGLVQTPAYAREVLSVAAGASLVGAIPDVIEEKISAQQRRQGRVLYSPGRRIQLVVGEAALRTRFGKPATLAGQLDRLASIAGMEWVEVGVLPFDAPSPILPLAGFALNDSDVVWVETLTGEQRLDDPDEVATYVAAFDVVLGAALVGDDAVELIRRR